MKKLTPPLSLALSTAFTWVVLGAGAIGTIARSDNQAIVAWAILAFVVVATLADTVLWTGLLASLTGTATLVGARALQLRLDHRQIDLDGLQPKVIATAAIVFVVTPFVLRWAVREIERVVRQLRYQASVIDDLTIRDSSTGAFKSKYVESMLSEEIDRARRYHRSLTLAIVAADDWEVVVDDVGELGARNLASRIVDQLARGTRTVDRIVQMGDGSFSIVLPETPLDGAEVLAARLQASASAEVGLTLRIGMADFPRDAVTSEALLAEAHEALTFARTADLLVVDRTLLGQGS